MGRGAGFFQLFAHPIRLGDDELRILALDIGQHPLAHVIGRIDVGKEEVGGGWLAIGPEIVLRLDAIDPDLVARASFSLMRSTRTCAAGLKGRPLRVPSQALLIISSSMASVASQGVALRTSQLARGG